MGVYDREYTFKENIAKNRIKVGMLKITSEIGDQLAFQVVTRDMVALKKVIMIFELAACWTVGTLANMMTMYNITNW